MQRDLLTAEVENLFRRTLMGYTLLTDFDGKCWYFFYWGCKLFRYYFTLGDFFQPGKHQHHCSMLRQCRFRPCCCGHSYTKLRGTSLKHWIFPLPQLDQGWIPSKKVFSNFALAHDVDSHGTNGTVDFYEVFMYFIRCSCRGCIISVPWILWVGILQWQLEKSPSRL